MLDYTQLQHYFEQTYVAKGVLAILTIGLILSIFQLVELSIRPSVSSVAVETHDRATRQAFVPSPLFGQSPVGVLQQTRLHLILKGTFAASHSTIGSAVIGSKDKSDRIYVVGDTVEGAIIKDIQPDYIVLEYEGNKEILRLPEGQRLTTP